MTEQEKLEEAKRLYTTANTDQKYVLESLFPELKELDDERIRKRIFLSLQKDLMATKNSGCDTKDLESCITWLEKQGQVKESLDNSLTSEDELFKEANDWLKSIKDRYAWKPTDEQMDNLSRAFNGATYRTSLLRDLYLDLKKLKGD